MMQLRQLYCLWVRAYFESEHGMTPFSVSKLGISIKKTNSGIGIPASTNSVRQRTKKMLDCVGLVWYRTSSGIVSFFFHSGTD
jgi:hypothetical protein